MLGQGEYESLNGTSVYRDFVELPSQLMENWATEKQWLDLWAEHYETGEKMPAELVEKIVEIQPIELVGQQEDPFFHLLQFEEGLHLLVAQRILLVLVLLGVVRPVPRHHIALEALRMGIVVDQFDNCENIRRIVDLRRQIAGLLGYETYADYVLEERMAENTAAVNAFLQELLDETIDYARADYAMINDYAHAQGFEGDVMPWDWSYYAEKYKNEKYIVGVGFISQQTCDLAAQIDDAADILAIVELAAQRTRYDARHSCSFASRSDE